MQNENRIIILIIDFVDISNACRISCLVYWFEDVYCLCNEASCKQLSICMAITITALGIQYHFALTHAN